MNNLNINRQHDLDEEQCRELAEDLLGKLVERFGGSFCDEGQFLRYQHTSGMKAFVEPKAGELDINIKLNFLTRSFAPELEKRINQVLDQHMD